MPGPGGRDFQQAYNCQAVVDSECQVIVAAEATNQASDKNQAVSMIEHAIGNVGAMPKEVSADAGYYSAKPVDGLSTLGVDPFIAPDKTRHAGQYQRRPSGRIPANLSARDRMRRKLRMKRGRQLYAIREETVEPVFGQIKQGRGFRHFLLRGPEKVNREWYLICTGHNLLKLFRIVSQRAARSPGEDDIGEAQAAGDQPSGRPTSGFNNDASLRYLPTELAQATYSSDGLLSAVGAQPAPAPPVRNRMRPTAAWTKGT